MLSKALFAEQISDNLNIEQKFLKDMYHQGVLTSSKKKNEDEKVFLKCTINIVSQLNALLTIEF